ncbi:hypothetical protein HanRHA438_Chr05g0213681 [Helianthus annuus]|nr:hypothetical protein HanRHA438_Chr05g0213681 [Helianthus annuus]
MYVDVNEKDGLPLHEKGHMDVSSSSSKATNLGKQKTMDNRKEFHVRNKDVQADLECRDLAGQFPSSRLEIKSFVLAGCIDTNLRSTHFSWAGRDG